MIQPLLVQQRLMVADLCNSALVQNNNLVGVADGAEAVGDDQRGAGAVDVLHRQLDGPLGFVVEAGGRFVEHQYVGIDQQSAGNAKALALATGEAARPARQQRFAVPRVGLRARD